MQGHTTLHDNVQPANTNSCARRERFPMARGKGRESCSRDGEGRGRSTSPHPLRVAPRPRAALLPGTCKAQTMLLSESRPLVFFTT